MRATLVDHTRPHQIRLFLVGQGIAVSCNCLRGMNSSGTQASPIEIRNCWEAPEALEVYRAWHRLARVREAAQ